ncbi:MAG: GH92 family glycosyl hydrolase [Bacteroidales bacterium]|nr:GH92 family glycosyl hydrolase [Bacteroidales bacterium]
MLFLGLLVVACGGSQTPSAEVNPFIGTALDGHTSPAASAPFGLVQLGPDTVDGGVAGYHDKDSLILGFSHTHLSGTGQGDLGDFLFVPIIGEVPQNADGFAVQPLPFSHKDEKAGAGYYRVEFPSLGIVTELTALSHTGCHRYTFSGEGMRRILVDMGHTLAYAKADGIFMQAVSDNHIVGGRHTQGWAPDRWVYFSALFSVPFTDCSTDGHDRYLLTFPESTEQITISVGLSAVDVEGAENNRLAEAPEADFDSVLKASENAWNSSLGRITVEGGTSERREVFYTALYHSLVVPNQMADLDGRYKNHLGEVKTAPSGLGFYFPLSLWDTFRSWNPLMTLLEPDLVKGMVFSMLDMYDLNGQLPLWPLWGDEVDCMIGYHAVSVIADAWLRGIRPFDKLRDRETDILRDREAGEKALKAMIDASNTYPATDWYNEYGYIPYDFTPQSVSMTLEYAYDDWCIARMAESLGKDNIAREYDLRALRYRNLLDPSTGFFRGKDSYGNWRAPFTPDGTGRESSRDYTEATAWQYRHFMTHDVAGYAALMGGAQAARASLDSLFSGGYDKLDDHAEWFVTGRIGKYAHGNEPSHATAWLYTALGDPSSSQHYVREIVDNLYSTGPDGLCGNEDCGQMSAWYVFAALGFYPLCPGTGEFVFSAPVFPKTTVTFGNGNKLKITADHPEYQYIKEVSLNGVPVDAQYITYDQLMGGGELSFKLSKEPCHDRDAKKATYSLSDGKVVSTPYLMGNPRFFNKVFTVDLRSRTEGAEIRYTLDGSEPTESSLMFEGPFQLDNDVTILARAFKDGFEPSPLMCVHAFPIEYLPAKNVAGLSPGCRFTYHQGEFKKAADVLASPVTNRGVMALPSIAGAPDADHFGYVFTGYIDIPEDGLWEFALRSDDGSILEIDGRLTVNNDGSHSDYTATGQIALREGIHSFRLVYLEDYEGQVLGWSWKGTSSKDFVAIPGIVVYH